MERKIGDTPSLLPLPLGSVSTKDGDPCDALHPKFLTFFALCRP